MENADSGQITVPVKRAKRSPCRRIRWACGVCLFVVIVWLAISAQITWQFTHRRSAPRAEHPPALPDLVIEESALNTSDGLRLGAWFVRGRPDGAAIVLLHGIGGSRSDTTPMLPTLHEQGYTILA